MVAKVTSDQIEALRQGAHRLEGKPEDFDPLLQRIGEAPLVLLGESSHGTHEFYANRARITQRLIQEKGFNAVAVEADWPDAYRLNRYVQGAGPDASARDALSDFRRFPQWMWRNSDVVEFAEWLREHNASRPPHDRVGFYGLDLYSLHRSIEAVIGYLENVDPEAAARARQRYSCFDHRLEESSEAAQQYGYLTSIGARRSCEEEAVEELIELREAAKQYLERDGFVAEDEQFFAEQNARLVANAEEYYRAMFNRRVNTWNLRDQHMTETLMALHDHLLKQRNHSRIAVWEHNSHIGDARATDRARWLEWNVGQLVRERYEDDAVLVGFSTNSGTVSAASDWGEPVERKRVRPAMAGSYEKLLHDTGLGDCLWITNEPAVAEALRGPMLGRAIGVIYRPETERQSHYFQCRLAEQFDAVLHYDETRAVEPLEPTAQWHRGEDVPETYPQGL